MALKRWQISKKGSKKFLKGHSGRWFKNQLNRWIRRNIYLDNSPPKFTKGWWD